MKKLITFIICILVSNFCFSRSVDLKKVNVRCYETENCDFFTRRYEKLTGKYKDFYQLYTLLKLFSLEEGIGYFSFDIRGSLNNARLHIKLRQKSKIKEIKYTYIGNTYGYEKPDVLSIKEDDYFDQNLLDLSILTLQKDLANSGYPKARIKVKVDDFGKFKKIYFTINMNQPVILDFMNIKTENAYIKKFYKRKLKQYLNQPFDLKSMKNELFESQEVIFNHGYYLNKTDLKFFKKSKNKIYVEVLPSNLDQYVFQFVNHIAIKPSLLKEKILDLIRLYKRELTEREIVSTVANEYRKLGFLDPVINLKVQVAKTFTGEKIKTYRIENIDSPRYKVGTYSFIGNYFIEDNQLMDLVKLEADIEDDHIYFNRDFVGQLEEKIKNYYYSKGFVSFRIKPATTIKDSLNKKVDISFSIFEGPQAKVSSFEISPLTEEERGLVQEIIYTKENRKFDPIRFEEDVAKFELYMKNQGFYFFRIENKEKDDFINYKNENTQVDIKFNLQKGRKLKIDKIIFIGNQKTRTDFLDRQTEDFQKILLTPDNISRIRRKLIATGLFKVVKLYPIEKIIGDDNRRVDLVISLKEKDFGLFEVAPGFRTDIGLKLSTLVKYSNIAGLNKTLIMGAQVNQRLDFNTLDEERQREKKSLLEYKVDVSLLQTEIFKFPINYNIETSSRRRRFFAFDADILRVDNSFSKLFGDHYTFYIGHEYQESNQFDATRERDSGRFQIGALTPGVSLDFRDNATNPLQGLWTDFSYEKASPDYLSQDNDDLTIDYYKITMRNRAYFKIPNGTIAMSFVYGIQENSKKGFVRDENGEIEVEDETEQKLTKGYIPSIKVFRLSGIDNVRGFSEPEINRIPSGQNINDVIVSERAYMVNFKFEPRYFVNDSMMLGVFYDAGRLFVNNIDYNDLRSSIGVSFRFLTPVGALQFDYGSKLTREKDTEGNVDTPGRLHVSIGFF